MGGGMEDTAKYYRRQSPGLEQERESIIDAMHKSYLEYSGKMGRKRNHPSREIYGQILDHCQIWNIATAALNKQDGGTDAELHSAGLPELDSPAQSV